MCADQLHMVSYIKRLSHHAPHFFISKFIINCVWPFPYSNFMQHSCIDIYAHSCLKLFSISRKARSKGKTHVQIMKFVCCLNMGFGRCHWSMRHDVTVFLGNKMADVEKLCGFWHCHCYFQ